MSFRILFALSFKHYFDFYECRTFELTGSAYAVPLAATLPAVRSSDVFGDLISMKLLPDIFKIRIRVVVFPNSFKPFIFAFFDFFFHLI